MKEMEECLENIKQKQKKTYREMQVVAQGSFLFCIIGYKTEREKDDNEEEQQQQQQQKQQQQKPGL